MGRKETKNTYCILSAIICGVMLTGCSVGESMMSDRTGQNEASQKVQDEKELTAEEQKDIQRPSETYSCSMQELTSYLLGYETDCPYISADIVISGYSGESSYDEDWNLNVSFTGDAEVTWQFYNSLEQMEDELQARAKKTDINVDEAVTDNAEVDAGELLRLTYYTFPLPEDAHALDIYQTLEERFGTEEQPIAAISGDRGKLYYFIQEFTTEEGYTYLYMHRSSINLVVKDRYAYGLIFQNVPSTLSDEELHVIHMDYMSGFGRYATSGRYLKDEILYWIDHEERVTVMEEPDRSFVEIRGVDTSWEGTGEGGFIGNFGLLKEADYEVPLTEDGPELQIHFSLAEDALEAEYEAYLIQGFCEDENYNMTVTDKESGEILQEGVVELCIELPDTITFEDLNADGYVDMFIDKPLHSNDSRAVADKQSYWYHPAYMLWNPQEQQFERRTEKEVKNSLLANQNGLTEEEQDQKTKREKPDNFAPLTQLPEGADPDDYIELTGEGSTEYVVQPGDCLWSISERFLGSGFYWTTLQREENAPEDPDYLLPGEIIRMPEKIYIRKDPYSRGGLKYEGSFQIEQPNGFQYYFLSENVVYNPWSDENAINNFPVTNEMGENALSEDWEAFQAEVIRCSEEICPGKVSNLQFEKYSVKGGCDLYGYSFEYDAGDDIIEYTHFIRLGAENMAEVIGVRKKEPNTVLINTTRYIAASFIDYGGESGWGWGDDVGPNVGADDWNYPLLHNLFTAAKMQFE